MLACRDSVVHKAGFITEKKSVETPAGQFIFEMLQTFHF